MNNKMILIKMVVTKPNPRKILITGLPGSGKSRLHKFLQSKGYNSVDADDTFLSYNGKKLPVGASMKWLLQNPPMWNEEKLGAIFEKNKDKDLYVVGVAPNMLKFLKHFDEVYYLDADRETLPYRLKAQRSNPYGTTKAQRRLAILTLPVAVIASKIAGFKFVDASLPTEQIFNKISNSNENA